jgi:hypothetical protein
MRCSLDYGNTVIIIILRTLLLETLGPPLAPLVASLVIGLGAVLRCVGDRHHHVLGVLGVATIMPVP